MKSGIYIITNTLTGNCYVGSSANLSKRKREHFGALRRGTHHSAYLQRSFNQHGKEAFTFSVHEEVAVEMLLERENYWIEQLKPAYNCNPFAASSFGRKYSPEQVERIREAQMRPEVRKKKSESLKGHVTPSETREKISKSLTGRPVSDKVKQTLLENSMKRTFEERSKTLTGKKRSEETRKRMSEAALARRKPTEEERQKLSESAKNRKYTDEGRRKRSEMMKARWQQRKQQAQSNQDTLWE